MVTKPAACTQYAATLIVEQLKLALHLQKIMQSFKEESSNWSSVRVIVIDKDFTEWKILKQEFADPKVRPYPSSTMRQYNGIP